MRCVSRLRGGAGSCQVVLRLGGVCAHTHAGPADRLPCVVDSALRAPLNPSRTAIPSMGEARVTPTSCDRARRGIRCCVVGVEPPGAVADYIPAQCGLGVGRRACLGWCPATHQAASCPGRPSRRCSCRLRVLPFGLCIWRDALRGILVRRHHLARWLRGCRFGLCIDWLRSAVGQIGRAAGEIVRSDGSVHRDDRPAALASCRRWARAAHRTSDRLGRRLACRGRFHAPIPDSASGEREPPSMRRSTGTYAGIDTAD